MDRKTRTDTVAGALQAVENARDIPIPEHLELDAQARIHWGIITRTRAAELWTPNDLHLAGELAICRSQVTTMRKFMRDEQAAAEREERPYVPPWEQHKYIEDLVKRDERLTRLLQLHPEATAGKARDQVKTNRAAAEARKAAEGASKYIKQPELH